VPGEGGPFRPAFGLPSRSTIQENRQGACCGASYSGTSIARESPLDYLKAVNGGPSDKKGQPHLTRCVPTLASNSHPILISQGQGLNAHNMDLDLDLFLGRPHLARHALPTRVHAGPQRPSGYPQDLGGLCPIATRLPRHCGDVRIPNLVE
jgi:hypothetical protein